MAVKHSRLGYYLAAIGDDEDAVRSLGIDTARAKLVALMVSAFFTAIGGTFYAQMVLFITPTRADEPRSLGADGRSWRCWAGSGTVFGPLWGALVLVPIAELTRAALGGSTIQGAHLIVYGAILMLVVRFLPRGIEGPSAGPAAASSLWIAGAARSCRAPAAAIVNAPASSSAGARRCRGLAGGGGGAVPLRPLANVTMRFGGAVGVKDVTHRGWRLARSSA